MIKGIIFDLGNTLIHPTREFKDVAAEGAEAMATWFFKKKRIKLDQPALVETFLTEYAAAWEKSGQTHEEIPIIRSLETALEKIGAPKTASAPTLLEAAIKIYFEPEEADWQVYPDAIDTLRVLKKDYQLGLYSNATDDAFVQRLINMNKLRPELSATFSSAGKKWRKPRPEGFELIARRWNLPPETIVVVGDTLAADVLGAQNAGMKSILVTMHEAVSNEQFRHIEPDAVAPNLAALPEIIAGL